MLQKTNYIIEYEFGYPYTEFLKHFVYPFIKGILKTDHLIYFTISRNPDKSTVILEIISESFERKEKLKLLRNFDKITSSRVKTTALGRDELSIRNRSNLKLFKESMLLLLKRMRNTSSANSNDLSDWLMKISTIVCLSMKLGNKDSEILYGKLLSSKMRGSRNNDVHKDARQSYFRKNKYFLFEYNRSLENKFTDKDFSGKSPTDLFIKNAYRYSKYISKENLRERIKAAQIILNNLFSLAGISDAERYFLLYLLLEIKKSQKAILLNKAIRNKLLHKESKRIANEILGKSLRNSSGTYWETINLYKSTESTLEWSVSEDIYGGVSGIALFLLSMYEAEKQPKYLRAALSAANWLIDFCKKNETDNYAFLTGRMGVVYLLIQLSKYDRPDLIEKALIIYDKCEVFLKRKDLKCEYLNGAAGTILCLLHLFDATGNREVLEKLDLYINFILDRIKCGKDGIHFDRSALNQKSLNGFAHGASGIAFVFSELGRYFRNKSFNFLSNLLYQYEDSSFDKLKNNWSDNRIEFDIKKPEESFLTAYENNDISFFHPNNFHNAWCYGAPGICLSRLSAFNATGNAKFIKTVSTVMTSVLNNPDLLSKGKFTLSLCHGLGGVLMPLLEKREIQNEVSGKFDIILIMMLNYRKEEKGYLYDFNSKLNESADIRLFQGDAGIGYFFSKILRGNSSSSILSPSMIRKSVYSYDKNTKYLSISSKEIANKITDLFYKRTKKAYYLFKRAKLDNEYGVKRFSNVEILFASLERTVKRIKREKSKGGEIIRDAYNYESAIKKTAYLYNNYAYYHAMIMYSLYNLEHHSKHGDFSGLILQTNPFAVTTKSLYNWNEIIDFDCVKELKYGKYYFIFIPSINTVSQIKLDRLQYDIASSFKIERRVKDFLDNDKFSGITYHCSMDIHSKIRIITDMIKSGILIIRPRKFCDS